MATYKRVTGDYNIISVDDVDNVIIDTNTVRVLGNLDVEGNLTYINVAELNVKDPFIVLNSSNTAFYPSNSGVLTHTAVSSYAGIRYDAVANQWQVSSSTDSTGLSGSWSPISTGGAIGGSNTAVQFNDDGLFGGSGNFTFDKSTNKVTVTGQMILGNINTTPTSTSNAVALYNKQVNSGGTGVYAKSSAVDDELISAIQAKKFALIF